jgi:pseudouridine-5'-phosphate glycosidase
MQQFFDYSPEVKQAIQDRKPILALESTLITHGLPYPQNMEVAKAVEEIARKNHVTPATIAIIKGKIKIGLTSEELELLVNDKQAIKAGKRDLPYLLNTELNAGTTVASTLYCADYAGIKVFATGGIGGVHRGDDLDISADLIELARTPIAVVCAGVKAILDVERTLEYLETHSIPIIGYRTDTLPAFYSSASSHKLPARVDGIAELVKILRIHWQLGMTSGVLIANPIPEENEIPAETIEPVIAEALLAADKEHIRGKEITPFLLERVAQATQGKSMQANISLIKNNVRLGAMLAHKLSTT